MTTKRKGKSPKPRATVTPIRPPTTAAEMKEIIRHNSEQVQTLVKAPESPRQPEVASEPPRARDAPAPPPAVSEPVVRAERPRTTYPGTTPIVPAASHQKPQSLLLRFVDWLWGEG